MLEANELSSVGLSVENPTVGLGLGLTILRLLAPLG